MELENNNRKTSGKFPSIWRLNNAILNKPRVKEEIKREMRKYSEVNKILYMYVIYIHKIVGYNKNII